MTRRNTEPAVIHVDDVTTVESTDNTVDWKLTYWVTAAHPRTVMVEADHLALLFTNDHLFLDSPIEAK